MIHLLLDRLAAPRETPLTQDIRNRYGYVSSFIGLFLNIILVLIKGGIGLFIGSVAIIGDALNNFSDASISIISLLSFKLSARPADEKHPFGHARTEYLFSTLISVTILYVAIQLIINSFGKITHAELIPITPVSILILAISIGIKGWLWLFYKIAGKRADSQLIIANSGDSIADVMATSAILISLVLSPLIGYNLDGLMGILVGLLIFKTGIEILLQSIDKLLGQHPNEDFMRDIRAFVENYDGILGIHDLILHDYGPGKIIATLHAEVDADVPAMESHHLIDRIEEDARQQLNIYLTIHQDPINLSHPRYQELFTLTEKLVHDIHSELYIHDFRIVDSYYTTNLIFDISTPHVFPLTNEKLKATIQENLVKYDPHLQSKISVDPVFLNNINN